ncbi:MAG: hypothetical protein H6564_21010 [Lewinellaceae bacterium]|nr:hypothetical protein [Lewinellaceae bacterium]
MIESGKGFISFIIDKFPLVKSTYSIGVKIIDLDNGETLLEKENIMNFSVENGNFFKSGKLPEAKNFGKAIFSHSWYLTKI